MEYTDPIDTMLTKIINCKHPHDTIVIDECAYICKEYKVKISINYNTNNTNNMVFTIEGIKLYVLRASIYIYELIKISMEAFPKANSNYIFKEKQPILRSNNTLKSNKILETQNTLTSPTYYDADIYQN